MHRVNPDPSPEELVRCPRHVFEVAEDICSECGGAFCSACLVYPFGPQRPALCVSCALALSGVRAPGRRKGHLTRRELARRRQLLAEARVGAVVDPLRLDLGAHPDFDAAEAEARRNASGTGPAVGRSIDWVV